MSRLIFTDPQKPRHAHTRIIDNNWVIRVNYQKIQFRYREVFTALEGRNRDNHRFMKDAPFHRAEENSGVMFVFRINISIKLL